MTFWVGVAVVYVVIASVGISLGRYLADRFPGRDNGGGQTDPQPTPAPTGPTHAVGFPPLGTAFDRALLPGVFDQEPVADHVG